MTAMYLILDFYEPFSQYHIQVEIKVNTFPSISVDLLVEADQLMKQRLALQVHVKNKHIRSSRKENGGILNFNCAELHH